MNEYSKLNQASGILNPRRLLQQIKNKKGTKILHFSSEHLVYISEAYKKVKQMAEQKKNSIN
jgi:hypothetical protein